MPLKLLPLPPSEQANYWQVCWAAFVPGVMDMMYPNGFSDATRDHAIASQKRNIARYPGRFQFLQVIDTELDRVVGACQWQIYATARTEEEKARESEMSEQDEKELGPRPGSVDSPASEAFKEAIQAVKKKYIGDIAHMHLQAIGTRPEHERRGVASLALQWGVDKADELHLPCFLEASEKGVRLYERFGFEIVEVMDYDATKHGYSEPLTQVFMKRPAKA